MRVFVTSRGVLSALGADIEETLNHFKSHQTGIQLHDFEGASLYMGKVGLTNSSLRSDLKIKESSLFPRTALLGLYAAQQCLSKVNLPTQKIGFINGTTTGGMDLSEEFYKSYFQSGNLDKAILTNTHTLGKVSSLISNRLNANIQFVNTISTACSSSANSIMQASRMIKSGHLDAAIAGGCDALTSFTIQGFNSLMIYSNELCKPFDANRTGLNLGEGAGYLLLESEKSLDSSGNTPIAEVTGWCNANDAHHQTASSPDGQGAQKAMLGALKLAELPIDKIDYLNAHGTATNNNDDSELAALNHLFDKLNFSSTKSLTGHTLGAAGGIEGVISTLSISKQSLFPNLHYSVPIEGSSLTPVASYTPYSVKHVMSNSFGFGGNNTSLIFSKV